VESTEKVLTDLPGRLRGRATEFEERVLDQLRPAAEAGDGAGRPAPGELHAVAREAFHYGLTSIELGADWSPPPPPIGLAQARRAAREGLGLEVVVRRYATADQMLTEFILEESAQLSREALGLALRDCGALAGHLIASLAAEYVLELERGKQSPPARLDRQVRRLLAGDGPASLDDFPYDLAAWHLGLVVSGADAEAAAKRLAIRLGRQSLVLPRDGPVVWAWLGGPRPLAYEEIRRAFLEQGGEVSVAVGESHSGLAGWRLTHSEARAAFQVISLRRERLVRARDVALLVAVMRDHELASSLKKAYLAPLGDSEAALRQTVRAYFLSALNAAATAALLGVDRHTVQRRLRRVEEELGRPVHECYAELKIALDLEEVESDR
jgi:hypothetical protein